MSQTIKYLTYEEFLNLGGQTDEYNFNFHEQLARKYLNYITLNRIPLLPEITDDIKLAMVIIIKHRLNSENGIGNLADIQSFKNDEVSITYKSDGKNNKTSTERLIDDLVAILPLDLVSRCTTDATNI